jgi:transcriptional regulator with XRE-family HTH domain
VIDIEAGLDVEKLYEALDGARLAQRLTWKELAEAAKVHPSTLSRMASGKRPDADSLALLAAWSGLNPAEFVHGASVRAADPLAQLSAFVHSDPNLSPEAATVMDELIKSTYVRLANRAPAKERKS